MKFFICKHCGNIIGYVESSGVKVMCCGEPMVELVPSSTDAAQEKHVPFIKTVGGHVEVTVGEVMHPMTDAHYIKWIALETKQGRQRKVLSPNDLPFASFELTDGDEVVNAYAYCNLHGLWISK